MLAFIACGALVGGACGALIWWGVSSHLPIVQPLTPAQKMAIEEGQAAHSVLLARQRLCIVNKLLDRSFDVRNYGIEGMLGAKHEVPPLDQHWWLENYDKFYVRFEAELERQGVPKNSQREDHKLQQRKIATTVLKSYYEEIRKKLLPVSEFNDRQA